MQMTRPGGRAICILGSGFGQVLTLHSVLERILCHQPRNWRRPKNRCRKKNLATRLALWWTSH